MHGNTNVKFLLKYVTSDNTTSSAIHNLSTYQISYTDISNNYQILQLCFPSLFIMHVMIRRKQKTA